MRIEEFSNKDETGLPFDVVDDLSIYMRNDPIFYRKELFPAIISMKGAHDRKETLNPESIFGSMVDKATRSYCKKFKINKHPDDLLTNEDRKGLIQKLYSEELNNIQKGVY